MSEDELLEIKNGKHKQFFWCNVNKRVMCKCGKRAVIFRSRSFLCSSITARPCKY